MADATRDALGAERVYIKERRRQRGSAQYSRLDERGERAIVREGGLSFAVNLGDYLDTGLFLDHRITRARLRDEAAGKRFLNLFCYTGAFTVYAAAGGASETVSVDLSRTYLSWARDNMLHNGFGGGAHRFVHQDVRVFLTEGRARAQRFDLIALDPPSFSNSKDMDGVLDVRRDHPALIRDAAALLAPGGALYFSTNRRGFQLNEATVAAVAADAADVAPEGLAVEDITRATTPPDFERRPPHRCWRIARG
jgi:23S rRNA G2069 N7-methylase RlmK/C1962 C5-methylase RlmI